MSRALLTKVFWYALAGLVVFDVASFLAHHWKFMGPWFFVAVAVAFFSVALWKMEYALLALFAELFFGSWGRMLEWSVGGQKISIRLALFLLFFLAWAIRLLLKRERWERPPFARALLLVGACVAWGVAQGFLQGHTASNVFFDVNGYLFLGLIVQVAALVPKRLPYERILEVLSAAVVLMTVQTYATLAVFSHEYPFIITVYRWLRDTRLFEITAYAHNFFRIFSQAHLYAMVAVFVFGALLAFGREWSRRDRRFLIVTLIAGSLSLLISFSRSFWLSGALATLIGVVLLRRIPDFRRRMAKGVAIVLVMLILEVVTMSFVANYPYIWNRPGGEFTLNLLRRRSSQGDDALASRYALLGPLVREGVKHPVIGSGFGTLVTFRSSDPRIVKQTGGIRTTFALEWGFLDFWLKMGAIGLAAWLFLFTSVIRQAWKSMTRHGGPVSSPMLFGFLVAFFALLGTHMTSPYFNHPLGLGFLLLLLCLARFEPNNPTPS